MKNLKKGFTLVELMVVIVIIGVLAALAIPRFMGASNKAKASEFKPVMKQIYTLNEAYKQERDGYGGLNMIGFDVPKSNKGIVYFTYALNLATTATSATSYTATATLGATTPLGTVPGGSTVTMTVDSAGTTTNGGTATLTQLANW